jgi:hypothetical protein
LKERDGEFDTARYPSFTVGAQMLDNVSLTLRDNVDVRNADDSQDGNHGDDDDGGGGITGHYKCESLEIQHDKFLSDG